MTRHYAAPGFVHSAQTIAMTILGGIEKRRPPPPSPKGSSTILRSGGGSGLSVLPMTPQWDLCAARSGASQPAGQRGAVLLSLHPASGNVGSGIRTTQQRESQGLRGLSRSVRSEKA